MLFCLHTDCMTNKDDINKTTPSFICGGTAVQCLCSSEARDASHTRWGCYCGSRGLHTVKGPS